MPFVALAADRSGKYLDWGTGLAVLCLSLFIMAIGALVSLFFGYAALAETSRKRNQPLRGRWMAVVGIIYGVIFLLLVCVFVVPMFRLRG